MALNQVDKANIRKEVINPGTGLRMYVAGDFKMRLNPALVQKILESYGIDTGGNKIHRIVFNDGKDMFVNDAGLAQVLA